MASVCGTCETYAGIRRKILSMLKICRRALRTMMYTSVLQHALNVYKTYPLRIRRVPAYLANFSYVGIRWLKHQGVTGP